MTISFLTFGCRLNQAESLDLQARLSAAGHTVLPLPAPSQKSPCLSASVLNSSPHVPAPDLIIVRGCSVTARAQRDCEKRLAALARSFPSAEIVPVGCLPGSIPASTLLARLAPSPSPAAVPLATSRAYLKVQDGCSGSCAFCIVPRFRGAPSSVPLPQVLARASAFLAAGYREIVVTGCNLALYRSNGAGLPALLSALASLPSPSPHRIRLGSLEPGICDSPLAEAFAAHPNLCPFIHLSLQSGSPSTLARMRRPYSPQTVENLVASLSAARPMFFSADVIAGFPGETPSEFEESLAFIRRLPFSSLHVFPYSERPGTPAASMPNPVPLPLRQTRAKTLETLSRQKLAAALQSRLGVPQEICVDLTGLRGRTAENLPATLPNPHPPRSLIKMIPGSIKNNTLVV